MFRRNVPHTVLLTLAVAVGFAAVAAAQPAPNPMPALDYDVEFFPGSTYDPAIPKVEEILGFRPGDRAAFPAEIETCLKRWAEASPRARLVEYARSYEGRALHYMIVTSPANLERIDEIQATAARLADPRRLSAGQAAEVIPGQPAIAWMAYSIHGDETSGTDSSLAVLYHLLAGTGDDVTSLLDNVVVLVDSMQNPDGRHRFLQQIAEHRGVAPNVDDQSLLHSGYWPWGRSNHYGFDLNRDWTLGVNPESRGRIAAAGSWHPQLMVDAHEMGSQDTYLFSPAREPRNPNMPGPSGEWNGRFAEDQAAAFDRNQWVYYTGEWNEGWYPGYTDAWGAFRGAVGILYEQAGFAEDGVRQANGEVVTYRQAVHQQAVSSIANLTTLAENREALLEAYVADRRAAMAADGPYADRVFAIPPTANASRLRRFVDLMELQGFEMQRLTAAARVDGAVDQLGRSRRVTLPAGTVLIANRQPEARLIATMLNFDERMPEDYLARERTSIMRGDGSTVYDLTAWNMTMLHGLEAYELSGGLPSGAEPYRPSAETREPMVETPASAVGWLIDGADDASVAAAARLMERGVEVRIADRAIELDGDAFTRGSVVVLAADNRSFGGDLTAELAAVASDLTLDVHALATGLGAGELPDLGGGHFGLLERPRIALLSRGGLSAYSFGSIWHTLDQRLAIRHSHVDSTGLSFADLRRYNVVVLPDRWFGSLDDSARTALEAWVEAGGTLIAIGNSATQLGAGESPLSRVRELDAVLDELADYEGAVLREILAEAETLPDSDAVWSHTAPAVGVTPWAGLEDVARPSKEEIERQDAWGRLFMPQGAFVAARVADEHWLSYGVGEVLPTLVNSGRVLMAKHPVAAPVRYGVLETTSADARRIGWSVLPEDRALRLRMSGLLWPEAADRLANAAAVTRERRGRGQIVLFANSPTFRASTHGTARLLLNAMIYGPGLGASAPIEP